MTEHLNFPVRSDGIIGDELLRQLARITGKFLTMGITLVVPGGVISGILTSRDEWLESWTTSIKESGEGGRVLAEALTMIMSESGVFVLDDEFPDKDRPSKLHIKDGYINTPTGMVGPYLMRVRVDLVSAWSLGIFDRHGAPNS